MRELTDAVQAVIDAGAGNRRITWIGVHTQGAPKGQDGSAAGIRAFHKLPKAEYDVGPDGKKRLRPGTGGNGWSDIGYNFVVRKSGLIELGRPLARIPAHATGANANSIGICCSGNGDLEDFTLAQYDSLIPLLRALGGRFAVPWHHVLGHRECAQVGGDPKGKSCPGRRVDMNALRLRLVSDWGGA